MEGEASEASHLRILRPRIKSISGINTDPESSLLQDEKDEGQNSRLSTSHQKLVQGHDREETNKVWKEARGFFWPSGPSLYIPWRVDYQMR